MKRSSGESTYIPSLSGTQPRVDLAGRRKPRILIVDDSQVIAVVFRNYLTENGYEFDIADSATAAMRSVMRSKPDVIIADVQMPGASGFELVAALRSLPGLGSVRFILMSSTWTLERRRQALDLHVEACLQKPVDVGVLLDLLHRKAAATGTGS